MTQEERLDYLLEWLWNERADRESLVFPTEAAGKRKWFRALVNVRPPAPAAESFLRVQDAYLQEEIRRRGITNWEDLTPLSSGLFLWQGDITTLRVDGIVNAANEQMLGCFYPGHGCIDNAIHTFAGIQLRRECAEQMSAQNGPEKTGSARITKAYNLPSRYVLHTVGPVVCGELTPRHESLLASCYRACLEAAAEEGLVSLAFCCISTGEFRFPRRRAAEIAVRTVESWRRENGDGLRVVFNVFHREDYEIYRELL